MNRIARGLWIFAIVIVAALIAYRTGFVHREALTPQSTQPTSQETNMPAKPPAAPTSTVHPLDQRLAIENQRLASLQESLNSAQNQTPTPPASIDNQIQGVKIRISETERQLKDLAGAQQTVIQNANQFRQRDQVQRGQNVLNLQRQMNALTAQIAELQNRLASLPQPAAPQSAASPTTASQPAATPPATPDPRLELQQQIVSLKSQQDLIRAQIQTANLEGAQASVAIGQQTKSDHMEVMNERANIQQTLTDLKAELRYWESQRARGAQQAKSERIRSLNTQIQMQKQCVAELESARRDTPSSTRLRYCSNAQ